MLHTAVIPVDRCPVFQRFLGSECLVVVRIAIPQEIPRGARPLRHGIGLALGGSAALRASGVHPRIDRGKRGFAVVGGLVAVHHRQTDRQLLLGNGNLTAMRTMHDRDRLTPITLTGEHPVTQLVINLLLTDSLFGEILDDGLFGFLNR